MAEACGCPGRTKLGENTFEVTSVICHDAKLFNVGSILFYGIIHSIIIGSNITSININSNSYISTNISTSISINIIIIVDINDDLTTISNVIIGSSIK